jgi:hypothetical protein
VKQKIIVARPPVYDRCVAKFGAAAIVGRPVIWSWGSVIYNPENTGISRELQAHEAVHGERQGDTDQSIMEWWERYLEEPSFRLDEELHAHRAEYRAGVKRHGPRPRDLETIAQRLAGALYGHLLTLSQAKHAILTGVMP